MKNPAIHLLSSSLLLSLGLNASSVAATVEHGTTLTDISAELPFTRPADGFIGFTGSASLDYDQDGDLDLFLPNAKGHPASLFENDGKGNFVDVAVAAGVASITGNTGVVAADIDNNGCVDLFTTGVGGFITPVEMATTHRLFMNNCDGTFTDIIETSGIKGPNPAMMFAFGDIDNDADLDLFITNPNSWVSGPSNQVLYLNNGDRTFTDISEAAGIVRMDGSCVVNFTDYDSDGWADIIVGNCNFLEFTPRPTPTPGPWELWRNNGDNTFTNKADEAGLNARKGFPMALTSADYDGDGDFDLFATGVGAAFRGEFGLLAEQVLFKNNGDGTYSDATVEAGLDGFAWGWGASFADFDNDGDEDLIHVGSMPNSCVIGSPLASPGRLYENDGDGHFHLAQSLGLAEKYTSGLSIGDFNHDGFADAVVNTAEFSTRCGVAGDSGEAVLLRNEGNNNHWLKVLLKGTVSNTSAVGAIVTVNVAQKQLSKEVQAGTSFLSSNSQWLNFGLGKHKVVKVHVQWPSGKREMFPAIKADQQVTLVEGTGLKAPIKQGNN